MDLVRPSEHADPVAAVIAAHRTGATLALSTSGTTGPARSILRSTRSWWGSFPAYTALSGVTSGSRLWVPGPPSSTMVLFAAVHAAATGAVVVADPADATHACLTPALLARRGSELSPGAHVVVAGAALPARMVDEATQRGLTLSHYYGAAELSFVAAGTPGSGLRPFHDVEVELRDAPHPGTIWVRSPWVCDGYEGTPGALQRDGGWVTVGDVGRFEAGVLHVLGRPDAVTTAGATVQLADVDAALRPAAHGDFAVHGVPHPTFGELIAVTLVDPGDLARLQSAASMLPSSHRPRVWRTVDELPLTEAGKIDRIALRDNESAGAVL